MPPCHHPPAYHSPPRHPHLPAPPACLPLLMCCALYACIFTPCPLPTTTLPTSPHSWIWTGTGWTGGGGGGGGGGWRCHGTPLPCLAPSQAKPRRPSSKHLYPIRSLNPHSLLCCLPLLSCTPGACLLAATQEGGSGAGWGQEGIAVGGGWREGRALFALPLTHTAHTPLASLPEANTSGLENGDLIVPGEAGSRAPDVVVGEAEGAGRLVPEWHVPDSHPSHARQAASQHHLQVTYPQCLPVHYNGYMLPSV